MPGTTPPMRERIRPPRFTDRAFLLAVLPAELQQALDGELAGMTFAPVIESTVLDREYDARVVGGISRAGGGAPSLGHASLSQELYNHFYASLTPRIEVWAGCRLEPTYGYGIRSYGRDSVLHLHRDRVDTHIISCIVHAADQSDQPWPLDFIDHDGRHHLVILGRGKMLFYESLCPHGRLSPFQGEFYRNFYFHWRPIGWDPEPLRGMCCKYRSLEECLMQWHH